MSTTTIYLVAGVAFAASWLVKRWLKSTYNRWSLVPNTHGVTGAQTAAAILRANGVDHVRIEPVEGRLTDHYDPSTVGHQLLRYQRGRQGGLGP